MATTGRVNLIVGVSQRQYDRLCGIAEVAFVSERDILKESLKLYEYLAKKKAEGYSLLSDSEPVDLDKIEPFSWGRQIIHLTFTPALHQRLLELTTIGRHKNYRETVRKSYAVYKDLLVRVLQESTVTCKSGDIIVPISGEREVSLFGIE
jgi:hypothetical protein